ncbi:transmembrane protein 230-like [Vigna umbellata]|uniref:transmembrane protein 230-like n=1 Tax=Vigna umbellata TaxID=87088 RepID=UPI001F5E8492|nr:transmembrane protein 230-like [Vigna umbellata]
MYVDHAFSISDEDPMMKTAFMESSNNKQPIKDIALAVSLIGFGIIGIIVGSLMSYNQIGGDVAHGMFFTILGLVLLILGFYYTRIAYYAYKGYKAFPLSNVHPA